MEITRDSKSLDFLSDLVAQNNELDIREYTIKIKDELRKLESECITDFLTVNQDVATLYNEINKSNQVLDKIGGIVNSFQAQLSEVSNQVSRLQGRSQDYNVALKNRKAFEKELHHYLEGILLPPNLIDELCNAEIDIEYMEKIKVLDQICQNIQSDQTPKSVAL